VNTKRQASECEKVMRVAKTWITKNCPKELHFNDCIGRPSWTISLGNYVYDDEVRFGIYLKHEWDEHYTVSNKLFYALNFYGLERTFENLFGDRYREAMEKDKLTTVSPSLIADIMSAGGAL